MATNKYARGVVFALLALSPTRGLATPTRAEVDRAEALFLEARTLMEAGRYAEACPMLMEAERFDRGGGTLLALALCHEGEGRGATAIREFGEARLLAQQAGRGDRVDLAKEHEKKLAKQVSRIIVSPKRPATPGLAIVFDQQPLAKARWGMPILVDAGSHLVVVTATGRKSWSTSLDIGGYGDAKTIEIPDLEPDLATDPRLGAPSSGGSTRIAMGYVVGGLGIVALGVGGYFGVRTFEKAHDYKNACPAGFCSDQHGLDLNADARHSATISTIAVSVGVVSLVSSAILFLSGPANSPESSMKTSAMVTATSFSLSLGGSF